MLKRIVTGSALLLVALFIATSVVPAVRAQVAVGKQRLSTPQPPLSEPAPAVTAANGYQIVVAGPMTVSAKGPVGRLVDCPRGKQVVGGGVQLLNQGEAVTTFRMVQSYPYLNSWYVTVQNDGLMPMTATFYAVCISGS